MFSGVDNPAFWMRKARGDLFIARLRVRGLMTEMRCFHAQQAAEKALKAVYVAHGLPFKFVHDLEEQAAELQRRGVEVPAAVGGNRKLLNRVTAHAVISRYSGGPPPDAADRRQAVALAVAAVDWAKTEIARVRREKKAAEKLAKKKIAKKS